MAERAHITSVEAIEAFRSSLIVYLDKMNASLDEVTENVRRTRMWIQEDQRMHWEGEIRRRSRKLEQAEQELRSARLSSMRKPSEEYKSAVRKAKSALQEAEAKMKVVKEWGRQYDSRVEPLARMVERLRTCLSLDMPKGVAYLTEMVSTLEKYAGIKPSQPIAPAEPSSEVAPDGDSGGGNPEA